LVLPAPPTRRGRAVTDDEILELWSPHGRPVLGRNKILAFARAVEARERERAERLQLFAEWVIDEYYNGNEFPEPKAIMRLAREALAADEKGATT
jgi:hypothetical protein